MNNQTIYEKIESKGLEEVNVILSKAKAEAKTIKEELVSKAKKDADNRINKAQSEANKSVNYKERLIDLEKRQALLVGKQDIITSIFDKVLERLNSLKGEDLLNYVEKLIKSEKVNGNEVIRVNKKSYEKYLNALSSKKADDLVNADLLNKKLDTEFKLSNKSIDIKNGFILEGKNFDLNFSLNEITDKLRDKLEKEIAAELFE